MSAPLRPLARQLPAGILRFDPATLRANSGDAWMASTLPEAVAFPRNTAQVSKILAFCHRRRIPVTTRGGGRGYVGGCVPVKSGLVLSMIRMNRILQISKADGLAVVQPGVITANLAATVARKNLFIPLIPPASKSPPLAVTSPPTPVARAV